MRISIINSYDMDGGAARSAYRLHRGLIDAGVASTFFTQMKKSDDATVMRDGSKLQFLRGLIRPMVDSIPVRFYRGRDKSSPFSPAILPASEKMARRAFGNTDVVNLHWIADGFVGIESLKRIKVPVVWTLHDSWPFTGGCHLPLNCNQFTDRCGACFRLESTSQYDLSRLVFERKLRAWAQLNLTIVAPSHWLATLAKKSALFCGRRIEVIPNGLDLQRYRPFEKGACRKMLAIPDDAKVILYSAQNALVDQNKGLQFIQPAISFMKESNPAYEKLIILICGASQPQEVLELGVPVRYMGRLHDDLSLAILYSAADVLLMPSMQENLPNTIMESMACGTPVVAFDIGGITDMVEHQKNGYLAKPYDCEDLARGLAWVLNNTDRQGGLSVSCRDKITKNFSLTEVAQRYQDLYRDLMLT